MLRLPIISGGSILELLEGRLRLAIILPLGLQFFANLIGEIWLTLLNSRIGMSRCYGWNTSSGTTAHDYAQIYVAVVILLITKLLL